MTLPSTLEAAASQPGGTNCPTCQQHVQIYRRKINSGMAKALIVMYRTAGQQWFNLPSIQDQWRGRDEAALRYFDLIEESVNRREDGGRAGWWRVTDLGRKFVLGQVRLTKYAIVYNGEVIGYQGDEKASIRDALGTRFNYDDLMAGR